ncbi:MAG: hypothetical protein DLM50_03575 [Candidatus Meridianibacter frigidus]|nr:MAG: hypothetical protein DLM50_03575 [Candidatus Eremiobacteraeota bacterium]
MPRNPLVLTAVLLLIVGALFLFVHKKSVVSTPEAQPQVTISTVRYGEYIARITAYGRVGAPAGAVAKPAFALPGILAGVDVRVGEQVAQGQPLAHLDTSGLAISAEQARADAAAAAAGYSGGAVPQAQLQGAFAKVEAARTRLQALQGGGGSAQSDLTSAQSVLRQTQIKVQLDEQTLQRQRTLFAAGVAARKDVDAAQAQLNADLADVRANAAKISATSNGVGGALTQARADYQQALTDLQNARAQQGVLSGQAASARARAAGAQRDLNNGTLLAPHSGVVTAIYRHAGESVDSTTPVVALGPASQNVVTLEVAAGDARKIHPGAFVKLRLSNGNASAAGHVAGVGAAVDPTTQRATVVVNGVPPGAIPGDSVEATIFMGRDRGVIIPQSAVVQDPQSGETVVFVQQKTKETTTFVQRSVRIGKSDGTLALILFGLRPGEKIATQGAFQLLAPSGA